MPWGSDTLMGDGIKKRAVPAWRLARNSEAWAIGKDVRGRFMVRRVVWGRILARAEKQRDEKIVRAHILLDMD